MTTTGQTTEVNKHLLDIVLEKNSPDSSSIFSPLVPK